MLRSAVAIVLGTLVISWAGLPYDVTFRESMVPVKMAGPAGKILYVSPIEVTVGDWQRCVQQKACSYMPKLAGSEVHKPLTGINWFDVNEYLSWANLRSGGSLRLPTKEEWLWLNRNLVKPKPAPLFTDPRLAWAAEYGQEKTPGGPVRPQWRLHNHFRRHRRSRWQCVGMDEDLCRKGLRRQGQRLLPGLCGGG